MQDNILILYRSFSSEAGLFCAGACLAVGLKYAGTGDSSARGTLYNFVVEFLKLKKDVPDPIAGSDISHHHIDKQALESVINTCALALSLVMAGTGGFSS